MSLRILVTGATGQVGWQLQRTLAPLGEVIARTRSQLDLSNPEATAKYIRESAPDIVVNAAAYTAVDKAENRGVVSAIHEGDLVKKGALCVGILETDDCKATYEELKAKGVVFHSAPAERPYGIEAVMRDDSGNYFSVVQRPR